jgi:glucan phosphoethanolaminetransferase (alkaline phosphatase superfamily)
MFDWLNSRRLHYWLAAIAIMFSALLILRGLFFIFFSGLEFSELRHVEAIPKTLMVGLRFDLRLAILLMLPIALLAWIPRWNLIRSSTARILARLYLALIIGTVFLVYIIDFGHYAYLGVRINATVFRFFDDAKISLGMVWQSYPVVWITLGWLATTVLTWWLLLRLERATLDRQARPVSRISAAWGSALMVVAAFLGILGRVENINLENPVPLRWSDAFFSGNTQISALGLNPVIFLYDTSRVPHTPYDPVQVKAHYAAVSQYLGVSQPDVATLDFSRNQGPQPYAITSNQRPNIVFVMLESLGTSAVGAYGNPLQPTPNIDRLAKQSWFFQNFYVPVTGTAKTVWASISGVPDVSRQETATRNPLITRQNSLVNGLQGYNKYYMINGNSGWANINALIHQSVDNVKVFEESNWKSPLVDVWGISDLDLFKESDRIFQHQTQGKPFFAFIQTSGNHRPFTIPKENDGFQIRTLPLETVQNAGSRTLAQYNAVRLLDFNIGRLMDIAQKGGWYDNTIFVMFGDHNTRISQIPHMPPAFEKLGLESNNVPLLIHAPKLLKPRVVTEAVGLVDLMPTVLGMAGVGFNTHAMGRDIQQPAPEVERVVPLVLREGTFPLIGGVTKDFLLQMEHDGTQPTLHDLASQTPLDDVSAKYPDEFRRLSELTRGLHETSRFMLYQNVRKD